MPTACTMPTAEWGCGSLMISCSQCVVLDFVHTLSMLAVLR